MSSNSNKNSYWVWQNGRYPVYTGARSSQGAAKDYIDNNNGHVSYGTIYVVNATATDNYECTVMPKQ